MISYENENQNSASDQDVQESDGHRDRIRRRILFEGAESLAPLQMLEFLLYYVLPRQDVEKVAKRLLDSFGDPKSLFHAGLEDFRRVEGLGENGAQWLYMIGRYMAKFVRLSSGDSIPIDHFGDLMAQAGQLLHLVPRPCCLHLLTDSNDLLVLRRPLGFTLEWAQVELLRDAMDDVSSVQAKNAFLLVFTDDWRDHPDEYDLKHIRDYALLLGHARCRLQDVVFIGEGGSISMRRQNLLPDLCREKYRRRFIAEDEMEALLDRDLKIINPTKEHCYDNTEPV